MTEYAILSALWARALAGLRARWHARHVAAALAISILWAIGDELHQAFVPSRSASPWDVGIDALGALLGQALATIWLRRSRRAADTGFKR